MSTDAATLTRGQARAMSDDRDHSLVERAKKGDRDAFSELVQRHQTTVYNLAWRFMRNDAAAQDMAQEAFLKAFRLLKGFRGDCAFSSWLYRVTSSVCLNELSRRKRRKEQPLGSHAHRLGAEEPPSLETEEFRELVRSCVQQLPPRYAEVVALYYLEEISYEEIAETLDIPLGTLKTRLHRARARLRKIVEKELEQYGQ